MESIAKDLNLNNYVTKSSNLLKYYSLKLSILHFNNGNNDVEYVIGLKEIISGLKNSKEQRALKLEWGDTYVEVNSTIISLKCELIHNFINLKDEDKILCDVDFESELTIVENSFNEQKVIQNLIQF